MGGHLVLTEPLISILPVYAPVAAIGTGLKSASFPGGGGVGVAYVHVGGIFP